jgi:flagellar biosynthesis protein FlhA
MTREVRLALSHSIIQQIFGPVTELNVIAIEPGLENLLVQALSPGAVTSLEPGVADFLVNSCAEASRRQEEIGYPACLLVPDRIRAQVSKLVRRGSFRLRVIGHAEVPETLSIRIGQIIGEMR